jgi:endonuclease YncB( thermonuclease family)
MGNTATFPLLILLAILVAPASIFAEGTGQVPPELVAGERARVVEVIDGDTVLLDDGWQVRLVGIQAPKLPLGRRNFTQWPLADEARHALEGLVLGAEVSLRYGGERIDRHGRRLAHLYLTDGSWVQEALLSGGMARVYSFPDNRAAVAEMLAAERHARSRDLGIWGNDWYAIRSPEDTVRDIGSFQLVEGRVKSAADVRGTVYLNFGDDWRTDFTVKVGRRERRLFDETGFDLLSLEGRVIRVRGWLDGYNGPMIEATHPEQIEILEN